MKEILFQTLIDPELWAKARWTATGFFVNDSDGGEPPCLGLVFEDIEAGKLIFKHWLERIGSLDKFEELYLSIIEGEMPGEDPGYSIHISSDPLHMRDRLRAQGEDVNFDHVIKISKHQRMTPTPTVGISHLDRFKQALKKHRRYSLIPMSGNGQPQFDCAIEKKEIYFRQTSDITKTDVDSTVFPEKYFDNESVN